MYKNKKILAIIPARSGSKGLRGKNIKSLNRRPLLAWSIKQAEKSRYIDKCIISTDSKDILKIAKKYKGGAPFLRPTTLSTDTAPMISYVLHAIEWFKKHNEPYDIIAVLQPTSPLRTTEDIDRAIELLFTKRAGSIVSVCETDHPPYWSNTLPKNNSMANFLKPEVLNKQRQMLPVFYRLNGAVYISASNRLLQKKTFFDKETFAYIMSRERSIDIDTALDFKIAEAIMRAARD